MRLRLHVVVEVGEQRPQLRLLRAEGRVRGAARAHLVDALEVASEPAEEEQIDARLVRVRVRGRGRG